MTPLQQAAHRVWRAASKAVGGFGLILFLWDEKRPGNTSIVTSLPDQSDVVPIVEEWCRKMRAKSNGHIVGLDGGILNTDPPKEVADAALAGALISFAQRVRRFCTAMDAGEPFDKALFEELFSTSCRIARYGDEPTTETRS